MARDNVRDFPALDSGRNAYRTELDPMDSRPLLAWKPFWADASEQLAYEDAVQQHPLKPGEGAMTYMARISAVVTGRYAAAGQTMPRTRMSHREWERRQNALKQQAWDASDWRGTQG